MRARSASVFAAALILAAACRAAPVPDPLPSWADGPAKAQIVAFNSDGDLQMLQYTAAGAGPRLLLIVHHTDAEREAAYDRDSHIGRLDQALDEARARDWLVVDTKTDWRQIFPQAQ